LPNPPAPSEGGQVTPETPVSVAPVAEEPQVDPVEQARIAKRDALLGEIRERYVKEHEGQDDATTTVDAALKVFADATATPDAILDAEAAIQLQYPQLRELFAGDPRLEGISRAKVERAMVGMKEDQREILKQIAEGENAVSPERLGQIEAGLQEYNDYLSEQLHTLFYGDEGARKTAAVALAGLKDLDPTKKDLPLQEYLRGLGYEDSNPQFFTDVEGIIAAQDELSGLSSEGSDSLSPAPLPDEDEKRDEEKAPDDPEAGPVATAAELAAAAEAEKNLLAANEEATKVALDKTSTQEQKDEAKRKLNAAQIAHLKKTQTVPVRKLNSRVQKTLFIGGGILAVVIIPTLLMLSIQGAGGK
jgi:hypothetical protein